MAYTKWRITCTIQNYIVQSGDNANKSFPDRWADQIHKPSIKAKIANTYTQRLFCKIRRLQNHILSISQILDSPQKLQEML